jgi:hypothetical protein
VRLADAEVHLREVNLKLSSGDRMLIQWDIFVYIFIDMYRHIFIFTEYIHYIYIYSVYIYVLTKNMWLEFFQYWVFRVIWP